MFKATGRLSPDQVFQIGKDAIHLLRDKKSSSSIIADCIDRSPQLVEAVHAYAQVQFRDRGRIRGTRDAITLMGLSELEKLLLGHLRRLQRNTSGRTNRLNHRIAALDVAPPPRPGSTRNKPYANQ